jgi:hypothetical protein
VLEFDSAEAARTYLDAFVPIRKLRSEAKVEDPEDATYTALSAPDPEGVLYEKTSTFANVDVELTGACIGRGPIVVELALLNLSWEPETVLARARDVLERVVATGAERR